jgi:hypothetical protein
MPQRIPDGDEIYETCPERKGSRRFGRGECHHCDGTGQVAVKPESNDERIQKFLAKEVNKADPAEQRRLQETKLLEDAERTRKQWVTTFGLLSHVLDKLTEKLAKVGFDFNLADIGAKPAYVASARIRGHLSGKGYEIWINVGRDGLISLSHSGPQFGHIDVSFVSVPKLSVFTVSESQLESLILDQLGISG